MASGSRAQKELFDSKMNDLLDQTSELKKRCLLISNTLKSSNLEKYLNDIDSEVEELCNMIDSDDELESSLSDFLKTVKQWGSFSLVDSEDLLYSSEKEYIQVKKESQIISKKLDLLLSEINSWFDNIAHIRRKKQTNKANEIKKVKETRSQLIEIDGKILPAKDTELRVFSKNIARGTKFTSPSITELIISVRDSILEVEENAALLVSHIAIVEEQLSTEITTVEKGINWFELLNNALEFRERDSPPNHPLSEPEIERLVDGEIREKLQTAKEILIPMDIKNALFKQQTKRIEAIDFSVLNSEGRNLSESIIKALNKMWPLKDGYIKDYFNRITEIEESIAERHSILSDGISSKLERHFKNDIFGKYIVHYSLWDEKSYIYHSKREWHRYPNYFFCLDEIKDSPLLKTRIDEIIKLPINSKLCAECLLERVSIEQALILDSIDASGDLFGLYQKGVDIELMFSLSDAEDSGWFNALLDNHEHHEQIMAVRRHPFDSNLWDSFLAKKIELWQLIVLSNTGFSAATLSEMCEGEHPWKEAEEYYGPLNDVEDRMKDLLGIYGPKNTDGSDESMQVLSLTDICKSVGEVAQYTSHKQKKTKSKIVRKRRSSYRID